MAEIRTRSEELQYLKRLIAEWNASRLDIFAISEPTEDLEYRGVMRFFFQDSGSKVATKCVRFTSRDNTDDVTKVLVDKFHPDMKMLSNPTYSLYEVHPNGDARKLRTDEFPLRIQLEWQNNDREGRFLLKSDSDKVYSNLFEKTEKAGENLNLKRRLSKREKKQLKKKREEEAKKAAANEKPGKDDNAIAQHLYDELPETSFTRSISNPEAVMRRRRQQKVEKRLNEFKNKDSPPGGTLKIFATTLKPEIPYKTILVSVDDTTSQVIKEALDKYQMEKEDPEEYCLIMVNVPPEGANSSATIGKERVVHDEDCPLKIAITWPSSKGTVVFHLRRRANLSQHRREKRRSKSPVRKPLEVSPEKDKRSERLSQSSLPEHLLPYLRELPSDDANINYKPRVHRLQMNVTEVGSEKSMSAGGNYLVLHAPHILQRHCVITNMDGRVSVTPSSGDAEVSVNGKRIYESTSLKHDDMVKIGRLHTFKFCDPVFEKPSRHSAPNSYDRGSLSSNSDLEAPRRPRPSSLGAQLPSSHNNYPSNHINNDVDVDEQPSGMFETTFDVTGEVTTYTGGHKEPEPYSTRPPRTPTQTSFAHEDLYDDKLPATLEFLETGEDAFFATVVSEVNGQAVHFKLAPTYTLYMCSRYRMSPVYRPELMEHQRGERLGVTLLKIANMARSTIRENSEVPGSLAFWMANCSELLHFIKQDCDISPYTKEGQPNGQQVLAQSVHQAFRDFVRCVQNELRTVMAAFIDPTDGADLEDSDLDSLTDNDSDHFSEPSDSRSYHIHNRYGPDGRPLSGTSDSWFGGRRGTGRATVSEVIYNLSSTMSLLRRCRVNAALTIQVFSQLFHFINTWLFNKLVLEPKLGLCTRDWGRRISKRLARVEKWAEKQGLELAADCHLCRIAQAAHLLQAPKNSKADVNAISSSCFKLNSLQVRTLLDNYRPGPDEYISQDLIESMVVAAEENADEVARGNGQEIQIEEDWELQLPFLLPEDGYSCEVIRGVPPGLKGFLEPLAATGLCRLTIQPETSGLWTVYLKKYEKMQLDLSNSKAPEVQEISFDKGRGGMGLSIVAAKGTRQDQLGIYIKQVVKDGPASKDGRLQAGDQILSVNGESLVGVTQERAAEVMVKSGSQVSLKILKQGAIYQGLATLLIQSPNKDQPQRLTPLEPEPDMAHTSPTLPDDNIPSSQWLQDRRPENMTDERLIDDRRRAEAEARLRDQKLREEEEERLRVEEKIREEERIREEEFIRKEEETRRREEKERIMEEERRRQEEEDRFNEERRRKEEEMLQEEEERRRVDEQRQERIRQQKIEDERRKREAEEDEKFRIQEDRIRKRMEEERRILEEERRKIMEERRMLEEEKKKEEERKRAEQQRLQDEQKRLQEEKQRIEEERRLVESHQMTELEQRRKADEDRRRIEEEEKRRFEEEERRRIHEKEEELRRVEEEEERRKIEEREEEQRQLAEEQWRREEIRRREEFRRREDQRRLAEERKRAEEEERFQEPLPPRVRKIRFEDEVIAPANSQKVANEPPVPEEKVPKPEIISKQDQIIEEEPVVVRGRLTEADVASMDAVFKTLEDDVAPPPRPTSLPQPKEDQLRDEPPKSPIRVDTRNTRYGRAIVITQGMLPSAHSPSSPNRPSKPVYDFDQVSEKPKPQEYKQESEFERWQRQQREIAEKREREAEDRERTQREEREQEERERVQREREERERVQREREERERVQREREEREREEREREEREQREREERERRDQERRERMQKARLERERREQEEQERLERERIEREKQEMERQRKQQEERELREKAERQRELERQRREQEVENRRQSDSDKERSPYAARERKFLYSDEKPGNKTLDYIESMSADEVEREFKRRLEVENKRRQLSEDRRGDGLVSVAKVTYHPDRNDQMERNRKIQMISQESKILEKQINRRSVNGDSKRGENIQELREEAEKKLSEEHMQQRIHQQRELERKLEEQKILREKENEARRQLVEEQRVRSGRGSSSEPDHVMELKERALKDYERRRALIDQEIVRQQAQVKFQEQILQKEMDDFKTKFDQKQPVSALKTSNGNKPKKQVSFSQMSTEIREPASPTYVVESSSGYTAKITPAASVRLVETRPPAELDTPPSTPPDSPPDSPPVPRPPPPEYDEYDPPPLPPPPSSDQLQDDDDFPPPPNSAYSANGSRSPMETNSRNYRDTLPSDYPFPQRSVNRNSVPAGYGTYPRAARPVSYPTPADLDSIQFSDSMMYSSSNNNINSIGGRLRGTQSLGRITTKDNSSLETSRTTIARMPLKDESSNGTPPPIPKKPEHLGFKDKMKLFNQDTTPQKRVNVSKWQREQLDVNGDVTYT